MSNCQINDNKTRQKPKTMQKIQIKIKNNNKLVISFKKY